MTEFKRSPSRDMRNPIQKIRDHKTVVWFAVLLAACAVGFALFGVSQAKLAKVRGDLQQMTMEQIDGAMSAYGGIDLRSANVEGNILPAMRKHFYYAQSLDNAVVILFGDKYEIFDDGIFQEFEDALKQYDQLNKRGQSTAPARAMLDECMKKLSSSLSARFDARGNLVRK